MSMTSSPPAGSGSAAFGVVVRGMIALHRLIANGEGDGDAADAVRDALDAPYAALSEIEAERVRLLSEDLYSLSDPADRSVREANPQVHKAFQAIYAAKQRREWEKALSLLRRWHEYLPPAQLSVMRGSIWKDLGRYEVAAEFYSHAAKLDPSADYTALTLNAVAKFDPHEAAQRATDILRQPESYSAATVIQAANVVVSAARSCSPDETRRVEVELMPVVRAAMTRVEQEEGATSEPFAIAALILGAAHEHSGETRKAYEYYSTALKAAPTNPDILTLRGILMYGLAAGSVTDLEQAVKYGAADVWPYFFLAHHHLVSGRSEECRRMCERALDFAVTSQIRSELTDWLAIAEAQLGFPSERVRQRFEEAIRFDPSNDRARQNLIIFEAHASYQPFSQSGWSWPPVASIRLFGLAEYQPDYQLAG